MENNAELKKAIEENRKLIEENQSILKKIRRSMVVSRAMTILYWVVIAGVAFGAYYVVQPYINAVVDVYTNVRTGYEDVQDKNESARSFGTIDIGDIFSIFGNN